jgi:16S rRNA (guanine(527)-N(7))-methyltransferase RsmG
MRNQFITAITTHQVAFGLDLAEDVIERLADYFELVQKHNPILHLVGPCSPDEFAIRHILESLTLLEHFPQKAKFADVGAGAGLPSIPCLLVRDDLKAVLIESKEKKAKFLESAVEDLGLSDRAAIINRQFEEADPADCEFVTCRALDKFTEKLPRLLKWSKKRRLLLFGGDNLRKALQKQGLTFDEKLMPMSEQRFLFDLKSDR